MVCEASPDWTPNIIIVYAGFQRSESLKNELQCLNERKVVDNHGSISLLKISSFCKRETAGYVQNTHLMRKQFHVCLHNGWD